MIVDVCSELKPPSLIFESCCDAQIGINYYDTVGSLNNVAYKRSRKIYKKTTINLKHNI